MARQHQAEQQYREAVRRIGQRWKALSPGRRVSAEMAKVRSEEMIRALRDCAAAEREESARIVDRYRTEHADDPHLVSILAAIAERIRSPES